MTQTNPEDTSRIHARPVTTPKDVFLQLLSIVTLFISVISLIALLFQYVNHLFPDQLNGFLSDYEAIRWSSSALIVVWPVFVLISWLIGREFASQPEKRDMRMRKWLTYLTLFIAAITIIVDLITLVYNFYSGELTTRFVLKVLAILIITAAVFIYYIWDLRRGISESSRLPRMLAWIVSAILAAILISGFFIAGSPAEQRKVRFDQQRVGNLQEINSQVVNYWITRSGLPSTLDDMSGQSGYRPPVDPQTSKPYEYRTTGALSYELCADFSVSSKDNKGGQGIYVPTYPYSFSEDWNHEAGRQCFSRTIRPDQYPNHSIIKQ